MALIEMENKISKATDNNLYAKGYYFYLSKAFDTIDHKILVSNAYIRLVSSDSPIIYATNTVSAI